jgi:hypothetical protein
VPTLTVVLEREPLVLALGLFESESISRVRLQSRLVGSLYSLLISDVLVTPATRTTAESSTAGSRLSSSLSVPNTFFSAATFDIDLSVLLQALRSVPVATITIQFDVSPVSVGSSVHAMSIIYGLNVLKISHSSLKAVS